MINKKVGVLPDVEQGAAGELHPPGHIGWQLCGLLFLADGTQSSVLEGELPDLMCAAVLVKHLPVLGTAEGQRLTLCLLSFCSSPGRIKIKQHQYQTILQTFHTKNK